MVSNCTRCNDEDGCVTSSYTIDVGSVVTGAELEGGDSVLMGVGVVLSLWLL